MEKIKFGPVMVVSTDIDAEKCANKKKKEKHSFNNYIYRQKHLFY